MILQTFTNEELGIEAVVMDADSINSKLGPFKVVFRDTDADATISVIFGSWIAVFEKAKEFVK